MRQHNLFLPTMLWVCLVVVTLTTRTLWPIDETRYASIAWEMWSRGDFLVPYLNGETYSHKPPLLFWLIHIGWWLFGVTDWWPRLVPALFGLVNLFLCAHLAQKLWHENNHISTLAPLFLFGSMLWLAFTGLLMFDMLVTFCVLLGITGLLHAWREPGWSGWLTVGIALGLGLLSKGPVIFLHIIPVAILAPWWATEHRPQHWLSWYAGIGTAVFVGVVIEFCWAIPAALSAGSLYSNAIVWDQAAGRVVNAFAHRQPLWWYLPLLPVLLFPWLLWFPVLRSLSNIRTFSRDAGVRLCLAWILPAFIGFSLISGKQMYYLLPLFPGFALLAAYSLVHMPLQSDHRSMLPVSLILIIIGLALLALPTLSAHYNHPQWVADIPSFTGIFFLLVAMALLLIPNRMENIFRVKALAVAMAALMIVVHICIVATAKPAYNLRSISLYLHQLESQDTPLAHLGKYYGQFHFIGRLEKPLTVIRTDQISNWFKNNPHGKLIAYSNAWQPATLAQPEFIQPYRANSVSVWGAEAVTTQP